MRLGRLASLALTTATAALWVCCSLADIGTTPQRVDVYGNHKRDLASPPRADDRGEGPERASDALFDFILFALDRGWSLESDRDASIGGHEEFKELMKFCRARGLSFEEREVGGVRVWSDVQGADGQRSDQSMQFVVTLGGVGDRGSAGVGHVRTGRALPGPLADESNSGRGLGELRGSGDRGATEADVGGAEGEEAGRRRLTTLPTTLPTATTSIDHQNEGYSGTVRVAASIRAWSFQRVCLRRAPHQYYPPALDSDRARAAHRGHKH